MPIVGEIEGDKLTSRSLMSRDTGAMIYDLEHLRNCIKDILTTPVGSRVLRRSYGSGLYRLIDRPINSSLVLEMRRSIFDALEQWEPRLFVEKVTLNIDDLNSGKLGVRLDGWYLLENRPLRLEEITLDFFRHNPYSLENPAFRRQGTQIGDLVRPGAKPMVVAFVGDCGKRNSVQLATAELVKEWNADLVLLLGDLNYEVGAQSEIELNLRAFQPWTATRKALAIAGNHDLDTENGRPLFNKFYYQPNNRRYWSKYFALGDVLLVGMNTGYKSNGVLVEPDGVTSDSVQGKWITEQFKQSTAKHKILLIHHPMASSLSGGNSHVRQELAWLKTLPISSILAAHTHVGDHYRYSSHGEFGIDLLNVSASSRSLRPTSNSGTTYGAASNLVKQWQYAPNGQVGPPLLGRMVITPDSITYEVYNVLTKALMHTFTRLPLHG